VFQRRSVKVNPKEPLAAKICVNVPVMVSLTPVIVAVTLQLVAVAGE
jgi:hypothetical protein